MSTLYIRDRFFEGWAGRDGEQGGGGAKRTLHERAPAASSRTRPANQPAHSRKPPQPSLPRAPDTSISTPKFDYQIRPPSKSSPAVAAMADQELSSILKQLHQSLSSHNYSQSPSLLSRAKICLLNLNALVPSPQAPQPLLLVARETLELGALVSIRLQDPEAFTRYFQQVQPFYNLPAEQLPREGSNASKVTGLYLLLQLSQGDYAGFHTTLEALETQAQQSEGQTGQRGSSSTRGTGKGLEDDAFIQYPIRLERALMEGSYDRVWGETKSERVPSEEFAIFSDVLIGTIRSEIASCSEKAYPSLPVSNVKNLLFLDSEGDVVQFAQSRGWSVKDSRIYFPQLEVDQYGTEKDVLATSGQVIENTLGYARELETIV
ncbi:MAG: regulatory particle non-ATPase [Bathelium mastoideum]|nr:MAG: regulatory particle non-ATPase [Bathelium mastoideum]